MRFYGRFGILRVIAFHLEANGFLIPWPIWTTIGWGFGLAYQFSEAYMFV